VKKDKKKVKKAKKAHKKAKKKVAKKKKGPKSKVKSAKKKAKKARGKAKKATKKAKKARGKAKKARGKAKKAKKAAKKAKRAKGRAKVKKAKRKVSKAKSKVKKDKKKVKKAKKAHKKAKKKVAKKRMTKVKKAKRKVSKAKRKVKKDKKKVKKAKKAHKKAKGGKKGGRRSSGKVIYGKNGGGHIPKRNSKPKDACTLYKFQKAFEVAAAATLSTPVNYVPNKTILKPDGKKLMDKIAKLLQRAPWLPVTITGISTIGGKNGKKLVVGRAKAAQAYLKGKGAKNKFTSKGKTKGRMKGIVLKASGALKAPKGCTDGFAGKHVSLKNGHTIRRL